MYIYIYILCFIYKPLNYCKYIYIGHINPIQALYTYIYGYYIYAYCLYLAISCIVSFWTCCKVLCYITVDW